MRIILDKQEVAAILINYGKEKYKTHNVSVEKMSVDGSSELLVTLTDDAFGSATAQLASDQYKNVVATALTGVKHFDAAEAMLTGPELDNAGNTEFL